MTCYNTNGMNIGVLGSDVDQQEYVQDVVFENLTLYDSVNIARIMTPTLSARPRSAGLPQRSFI